MQLTCLFFLSSSDTSVTWQGSLSSGGEPLINFHSSLPALDNLFKLSSNNKDSFNIFGLLALNAISCIVVITNAWPAFWNAYKVSCPGLSSFFLRRSVLSFNTILDWAAIAPDPPMVAAAEAPPLRCNVSHGSAVQNRGKWTLSRFVHAWRVKITYGCAVPSVATSVQVLYFGFIYLFIYFSTADGSQTHMLSRTAARNVSD